MSAMHVRRWQPTVRRSSGALVALALVGLQAPLAVGVPSAVPQATANGVVLTASAATLLDLTYDGVVAVPTSDGDVSTIQLRSTAATWSGLALHTPCAAVTSLGAGMMLESTTPQGSTSTASAGMTLLARSLRASSGGVTVTWTPDTPPPAQSLGDVDLTNVTIDATILRLPAISAPGLREATSFCTPA